MSAAFPFDSYSQLDTLINKQLLSIKVGSGLQTSTQNDFLPFYLVNNQYGEVDENNDFFITGELSYSKAIGNEIELTTGFSFRNDLISSHFVRFDYHLLYLGIGREKRDFGGIERSMSSGSLGLSNNARPIPMIFAGLSDYVGIPFTSGYFEIKGHLGHGWLEKNRYISEALLHSKSFYLKLNLDKEIGWTASSGIVHFAQYGGVSPQGDRQPSSFSDFLRVFAGSGIPNPDGTTEGESNGLGNHLGIIDTHVSQKLGEHMLILNYQKPFEDQGGLQYISLTDYLIGLEWSLPNKSALINELYLEYMQTRWQGGPGLPDATADVLTEVENFGYAFGGRDDIYNNWLYRSGWTYQGQVIGNPLFLTHERTLNFTEAYPDYGVAIANNRIRAVHLGIQGSLSEKVSYEGLLTYTQNFGTHAGLYEGRFAWDGAVNNQNFDYVFLPMQEQFYTQLRLRARELFKGLPISFDIRVAYDFGDLYTALGSEVSVNYSFSNY